MAVWILGGVRQAVYGLLLHDDDTDHRCHFWDDTASLCGSVVSYLIGHYAHEYSSRSDDDRYYVRPCSKSWSLTPIHRYLYLSQHAHDYEHASNYSGECGSYFFFNQIFTQLFLLGINVLFERSFRKFKSNNLSKRKFT